MNTAGIICEYNPFHNGHLYHINETKKHADFVVCVMSGSFVQRGVPAICDKFSRADEAVKYGADIVIELPQVFALSSAERFAYGGVFLLESLGFINFISFGAESESFTVFDENDTFYKSVLKEGLNKGLSFPSARAAAVKAVFGEELSKNPNDILAHEYIKSLKKLGSAIKPLTIQRKFNGYHDESPNGRYASASYIRSHPGEAPSYMPGILPESEITDFEKYRLAVLSHLRCCDTERLSYAYGCSEGLENRIKHAACEAENFDGFLNAVKTKRYTEGRILRLIACSMLGIGKEEYVPEYIRILSLSKNGCRLLRNSSTKLPVITNLSKQKIPSSQLKFDIKASNLRSLFTENTCGNTDFRRSPRVINRD